MGSCMSRRQRHATTIVDRKFCVPYPVELTCTTTGNEFLVTNADNSLIFEVMGKRRNKKTLLDSTRNPQLTVKKKKKVMTMHHEYRVYRGASTTKEHLLFTITSQSTCLDEGKMIVRISSNVDLAFVVSLFMIVADNFRERKAGKFFKFGILLVKFVLAIVI
ncbi:hypothetical protein ACFE04_015115 [Oxalis oulophora]